MKTKIKNWESRLDLQNRSQAHAPKKSYSIGANFDLNNNLYVKLDINGKSSFYYSNSHDNKSKRYQLLNTTIGYSKANLSAEFWMTKSTPASFSSRFT